MRLTLAFLLAATLLAPAAGHAYPNEPGKLFGIAWGTPFEKVPGLKSIDGAIRVSGPGSEFYNQLFATPYASFILPTDSEMGGLAVRPIFKFKRAKLAAVEVIVEGPNRAGILRHALLRNFGNPDRRDAKDDPLGSKFESLEWNGAVTTIKALYTDRKSAFLKPDQNVMFSVRFVSPAFSVTPDERMLEAVKGFRYCVDLFLRTSNRADIYTARKEEFRRGIAERQSILLEACDAIDAELGREATRDMRLLAKNILERELDVMFGLCEALPPGNPHPAMSAREACQKQWDMLHLVIQKMEREAGSLTAALTKR